MVGNGWCRPNCNIRSSSCRLNGYLKKDSNHKDCKTYCYNEPSCTGYSISKPSYAYPNRCYVYGNIKSEIVTSSNGWVPHQKYTQGSVIYKTSGHRGVSCFKRASKYKGKCMTHHHHNIITLNNTDPF